MSLALCIINCLLPVTPDKCFSIMATCTRGAIDRVPLRPNTNNFHSFILSLSRSIIVSVAALYQISVKSTSTNRDRSNNHNKMYYRSAPVPLKSFGLFVRINTLAATRASISAICAGVWLRGFCLLLCTLNFAAATIFMADVIFRVDFTEVIRSLKSLKLGIVLQSYAASQLSANCRRKACVKLIKKCVQTAFQCCHPSFLLDECFQDFFSVSTDILEQASAHIHLRFQLQQYQDNRSFPQR